MALIDILWFFFILDSEKNTITYFVIVFFG